jgi:membrane-associated protein
MDMITLLKTFGYAGVWTALFIEGAFIFGIFLPGDTLLFPIGILAGQDVFNLWVMLPGCFIAAFLGNLAGYEIGKRWGPKILEKNKGKIIKEAHIQKCNEFFDKYGAFTVVISRFIHFARTLVPFMAGMTGMPYKPFVIYSAIGALLWATGVPLLGYFVGSLIPEGTSIDHYLLPAIGAVILLVAIKPLYKKFIAKKPL